jgi:hypothetical protein
MHTGRAHCPAIPAGREYALLGVDAYHVAAVGKRSDALLPGMM